MYDNHIATVIEWVAALEHDDPVRLAVPPGYPLENTVGQVVCTHDVEYDDPTHTDPPVVWLGADEQVGYLPDNAANALGWSA